jgi:plastocyanin domain-containing protein
MKKEKIKNSDGTNKTVIIIITLGLIVFLGIIFTGGSSKSNNGELVNNVEVREGIQYITINAKGGYTPQNTTAKSGIPTKLLVDTNGTFDCSASLVIRKVGFQQILPQTGETEIDLGTPKAGENFQGLCGMGMYNFEISFS